MKNAIVLAAGKGTRMKSAKPKVLHQILGMPMVELIVSTLKDAGAERIIVVAGYGHEQVEQALAGQCEFALQEQQLGTGHAVMMAHALEHENGTTLVVNGDAPAIRKETFEKLYEAEAHSDMAVLTTVLDDAGAYGRIIRRPDGSVEKIVEFKDASQDERAVHEINTGIYAFDNQKLFAGLKKIRNDNAQHEYYITDLVQIFNDEGWSVSAVKADDPNEVQGCNDNAELARAAKWLGSRINLEWMKQGVTMIDPDCTYIGPSVRIGHDVIIHPGVSIYGRSIIEDNVTILPGAYIENSVIRSGSVIKPAAYITDQGEKQQQCQ